jgi:hypothetical protein
MDSDKDKEEQTGPFMNFFEKMAQRDEKTSIIASASGKQHPVDQTGEPQDGKHNEHGRTDIQKKILFFQIHDIPPF